MKTSHAVSRRSLWLNCAAVVIVATGCTSMAAKGPTTLTGAQEVPPVSTLASGKADISVEPFKCPSAGSSETCPTLLGTVTTAGVDATSVEIRDAAPGHNGPIVVRLARTRDNTWQVPPGTTLTPSQYEDYWAGRLYVSVDSDAHRTGEIRAQLRR
jgi:hypothetical protein